MLPHRGLRLPVAFRNRCAPATATAASPVRVVTRGQSPVVTLMTKGQFFCHLFLFNRPRRCPEGALLGRLPRARSRHTADVKGYIRARGLLFAAKRCRSSRKSVVHPQVIDFHGQSYLQYCLQPTIVKKTSNQLMRIINIVLKRKSPQIAGFFVFFFRFVHNASWPRARFGSPARSKP